MTVQKQTKPTEPKKTYYWLAFYIGVDHFENIKQGVATFETELDLLTAGSECQDNISTAQSILAVKQQYASVIFTNLIERRQTNA